MMAAKPVQVTITLDPDIAETVQAGVAAGSEYGLGHAVILSATESTSEADIERLVSALHAVSHEAEAAHV